MLIVPGFYVVIIKLVEYDVAEVVVARGTGLVAAAGKISGKKGFKKKMNEGFRLPGWRLGGRAGIYWKTDSNLAAETFSLRIFFTTSQSMRGMTLSLRGTSSKLNTLGSQVGVTPGLG